MSAVVSPTRLLRYGSQLVAGLAVGLAIGLAAQEAHAADTTASLLANPRRLAEVQQGCKVNAPWATEALCREAAQAIRLRFRGKGVPYTPRRVDPFPSHPATKPAPREKAPEGKPRAQEATRSVAHPVSGRS